MFFLPLIRSLTTSQSNQVPSWTVHLLCLSRGNFDGLGNIREQELHACSQHIGIDTKNVYILEDPKLQDGMQEKWDHDHIAEIVLTHMNRLQINAIFTFDNYGVSGHPNHISVYYGVRNAIIEQNRQCSTVEKTDTTNTSTVKGWALESTSLARKYIGVLDALVVVVQSLLYPPVASVFLMKPWWNYQAMALHASQFVWYRRLFVVFSRYTFLNTFQAIVTTDDDEKKHQ